MINIISNDFWGVVYTIIIMLIYQGMRISIFYFLVFHLRDFNIFPFYNLLLIYSNCMFEYNDPYIQEKCINNKIEKYF